MSAISALRYCWRLTRLFLHLVYGVVLATLVLPWQKGGYRQLPISRWSADMMRVLNVRLIISGNVPPPEAGPILFVSNHISWLDIQAIYTVRAVRFVAKAEIRHWPVIGYFSQKVGTIFIQRSRLSDTSRVYSTATAALKDGDCLCVFPEGTTTDGTKLSPFRSSLFQSAIDANALVWPLALSYPLPNGQPNTAIAYTGDVSLAQSVKLILSQQEITLQLKFSAPIDPAGLNRRDLAQKAEAVIASQLYPPLHATPETHADLST